MFDSITGPLVRKDTGGVVITAGGLGYRLQAPERTIDQLSLNAEATLYTHLMVKDDSIKLYGFKTPQERDLFLKIMSVSGVGAATGLLLLSKIPPDQFLEAISREQAHLLQSVKGIGVRTAKRLILDLKGKLDWAGFGMDADEPQLESPDERPKELAQDLVAALCALGYPKSTAKDAASRALMARPESEDLQDLIKTALQGI